MRINPTLRGKLTVVARGEVSSPAISADGDVVAYNQFKDGETAVYRHEDDRTSKISDGHASMHPDLSADGSKIVFTRFNQKNLNDPGNWDVALWSEESGETKLVSDQIGNEMSPSISDDGRVIVWDDDVDGKLGGNNIVKMVGNAIQNVTESSRLDMFPVVSGDGSRIVWRRYSEGKSSIFIEDQNGVAKPYLEAEGNLISPALSADGFSMIYADKSGKDEDLMLYDDRQGTIRTVAGVDGVRETMGDLSGDGLTAAWTGMDFRKGAPADTNIYMRREGESVQVTTHQGGRHSDARLSHDGKTLVWTWADAENVKDRVIYKLELD
jgi:Tol biopolymer transport system component